MWVVENVIYYVNNLLLPGIQIYGIDMSIMQLEMSKNFKSQPRVKSTR